MSIQLATVTKSEHRLAAADSTTFIVVTIVTTAVLAIIPVSPSKSIVYPLGAIRKTHARAIKATVQHKALA